jgi:hypothetical protein
VFVDGVSKTVEESTAFIEKQGDHVKKEHNLQNRYIMK